jgi:hypothetical protein
VHQAGDQTKVILRCTVNQPSRFTTTSFMAFIFSISTVKKRRYIGCCCLVMSNNDIYTFGIQRVILDRTVCGCVQMTRCSVNVATVLSRVTQNALDQFAVCVVFDYKKKNLCMKIYNFCTL